MVSYTCEMRTTFMHMSGSSYNLVSIHDNPHGKIELYYHIRMALRTGLCGQKWMSSQPISMAAVLTIVCISSKKESYWSVNCYQIEPVVIIGKPLEIQDCSSSLFNHIAWLENPGTGTHDWTIRSIACLPDINTIRGPFILKHHPAYSTY